MCVVNPNSIIKITAISGRGESLMSKSTINTVMTTKISNNWDLVGKFPMVLRNRGMHRDTKFYVFVTVWMSLFKFLWVTHGWSCPCLHDVALLNGSVLQAAGLLLEPQGTVAHGQAGDHLLRNPQGTLALLYCLNFRLQWLHFRQQMLETKSVPQ